MDEIESLLRDEKSPYFREDRLPVVRPSIVVFLDILGFKELIARATISPQGSDLLVVLRSALDRAVTWLNRDFTLSLLPQRGWDFKAFTDNFVIGYPIDLVRHADFWHIFHAVSWFQIEMMNAGFAIRGAITYGDLYVDRDIAFGAGLVEAYGIESRIAVSPRVVVAKSALQQIDALAEQNAFGNRTSYSELTRDPDGEIFVNYLDAYLGFEEECGVPLPSILQHKRWVEGKLSEHRDNPSICSKYRWVAHYHNFFCSQHPEFSNLGIEIVSSFQPMRPFKDLRADDT